MRRLTGVFGARPVGITSRLAWNPGGMEGVFNEAKLSVMVARCASTGGVLGVENVVGIQVHCSSFGTFDNDILVHKLACFRSRQAHVSAHLFFPLRRLEEHTLHRKTR